MHDHPGQVRVLKGVERTLLDTHEATTIEFRDRFNDLNAIITRHFSDDLWIFVTKNDPDWEAHLVRLGYMPTALRAADLAKRRG